MPATSFLLEPVDASDSGDPPPPTPTPIPVVLGTNLAYEAVSQSSAMVVQNVGMLIQQFSTVSTAAMAVVTEKLMQDAAGGGDPTPWVKAFGELTANMEAVGKVYGDLGTWAALVQSYFVPGAKPPTPPTPPTPPSAKAPPDDTTHGRRARDGDP